MPSLNQTSISEIQLFIYYWKRLFVFQNLFRNDLYTYRTQFYRKFVYTISKISPMPITLASLETIGINAKAMISLVIVTVVIRWRSQIVKK